MKEKTKKTKDNVVIPEQIPRGAVRCEARIHCGGTGYVVGKAYSKEALDGSTVCFLCFDDYNEQLIKNDPAIEEEHRREVQAIEYKLSQKKMERQESTRRMHLKSRYKMTPEEFDAMMEKQQSCCANCRKIVLRFLPLMSRDGQRTIALICRNCANHPDDITIPR